MIFLTILILPLLVAIASFIFLKGITWKEFVVHVGAVLLVVGISVAIIYSSKTSDVEVWNSSIINKKKVYVSCTHSYSCPPCTESCSGSGKNKSCTTTCSTCYDHSNDWDWDAYTSIGETIEIERIDRQGADTPPRWASIRLGDPATSSHGFTNYIKGAPSSLFRHQGIDKKFAGRIPRYPSGIYDYYKINRLVTQGVNVPNPSLWNEGLSKINAELGAKKQVNMIIVLTNENSEWYYGLEESWIGGKKNDAILIISVNPSDMKPKWAHVMAWTTEQLFEVKLRDDIMNLPVIEVNSVLQILHDDVSKLYHRKPMADFKYLSHCITPTTTEFLVATIISLIISILLTWFFEVNDVFNEE